MAAAPPKHHRESIRLRSRTSIRARLSLSHVAAVTASTFVYATGGFVLFLALLYYQGYRLDSVRSLAPQVVILTVFTLIQIALITVCGMIVAAIVSRLVSRSLLRQIAALEQASALMEVGDFSTPVEVVTEDELGRLARRFNELAARLDQSDRQRRAFVANISHDLRTPIAVIRGHIDTQLREGERSDVSPAASFEAIDREIATLAHLIEDLFTLSRIEEGVLPVASGPVDVAALIRDSVASLRAYALGAARVSVNAELPVNPVVANADATRVTQIINNLVHNAIRHTPAGGLVLVQARTLTESHEVHVTVRDTGVGIPPEVLTRVFDRYYRGESIGQKGGAGLGLNIVKQLVELQHGQVWVDSVEGEGTAVSFTLPANAGSGQSALTATKSPAVVER